MVAECVVHDIYDPIRGVVIKKNEFVWIILAFDLVVVFAFTLFIILLEKSQKQYITQFKDQSIEMTDFAIAIDNLPQDYMYGGKEEVLRAYLTAHFESVLKKYMVDTKVCNNPDAPKMKKRW